MERIVAQWVQIIVFKIKSHNTMTSSSSVIFPMFCPFSLDIDLLLQYVWFFFLVSLFFFNVCTIHHSRSSLYYLLCSSILYFPSYHEKVVFNFKNNLVWLIAYICRLASKMVHVMLHVCLLFKANISCFRLGVSAIFIR